MLYIKFDKNKVIMKTSSKEQADFYGLKEYKGQLEIGYDGCEYKKGTAPAKPEPTLEEQLLKLEQEYNMPRVTRDIILANPSMYNFFIVERAKKLEEIAEQIRGK